MKKQAGFSAVEIVMALVIVSLIGVVSWQAVKGHQKAVSSVSPSPRPAQTDPYAGWKTFTSKYEAGLHFRYPSNWTTKPSSGNEDGSDGIELTSPSGLTLRVVAGIDGFGGGCDPDQCPYNDVFASEPLKVENFGSLYIDEWTMNDGANAQHILGFTREPLTSFKGFPPYMMYSSLSHQGGPEILVSLSSHKAAPSTTVTQFDKMTPTEFFNLADVKTAHKILESWSY